MAYGKTTALATFVRLYAVFEFLPCIVSYYYYNGNMIRLERKQYMKDDDQITRYADMFAAMGTEVRLRIMRLLLSAHPEGMVVGDIQSELEIPGSTLSHHLEKLKNEDLVQVRRNGTFLWYAANTEVLQEILGFLFTECCTRNRVIKPESLVREGKCKTR